MTGSSNLHQFNKELHGSAQQYNGRINSCHIIYVSRPVGATLKSVGLENSIRVSGKNNVRIVMADTVGMTVLDSKEQKWAEPQKCPSQATLRLQKNLTYRVWGALEKVKIIITIIIMNMFKVRVLGRIHSKLKVFLIFPFLSRSSYVPSFFGLVRENYLSYTIRGAFVADDLISFTDVPSNLLACCLSSVFRTFQFLSPSSTLNPNN